MQKRISRTPYTIYHIPSTNLGFTIIELLVVIVIIGILSAITFVTYNGIQGRAIATSLQSDLTNASDQLVIDQARSGPGSFPATMAAANGGAGISTLFSTGTTPAYTVNNTNTPKTFCLTATKSNQSYFITQEGIPLPGPCPVLYLDASIPTSYSGTGTNWTDLSGNGNNATLVGGAFKENDYMVCNGTAGGNNDYIEITNSAASQFFNNPTNMTIMIVAQINRQSGVWGGADVNVYGHIIGKGAGDGYQTAMNAYSIYYDARNNYMANGFYRGTPSTQYPNQIGAYRFEYGWADSQTANNWGEKFMAFQVIRGDGNYSYYWYRAGDTTITGSGTYTTGGTFDNAYNLRICADYSGRYNKQRTWMVSLYNQALTDSEVQQTYNAHRNRFGL